MKVRTWHLEGLFVWLCLSSALVLFGHAADWREWVSALGVQLGFHHASVADRLREAEEKRRGLLRHSISEHDVECLVWLTRYWVGKEVAWVAYFLAGIVQGRGGTSALVGCAVFIAHPFWRRWYRRVTA